MSQENPGKDNRCDHCNATGQPYTYRGRWFDGLHANRGERLCPGCLDVAVQADFDTPVGAMQVPARDYAPAPIWAGGSKAAGYVKPKRGRKS